MEGCQKAGIPGVALVVAQSGKFGRDESVVCVVPGEVAVVGVAAGVAVLIVYGGRVEGHARVVVEGNTAHAGVVVLQVLQGAVLGYGGVGLGLGGRHEINVEAGNGRTLVPAAIGIDHNGVVAAGFEGRHIVGLRSVGHAGVVAEHFLLFEVVVGILHVALSVIRGDVLGVEHAVDAGHHLPRHALALNHRGRETGVGDGRGERVAHREGIEPVVADVAHVEAQRGVGARIVDGISVGVGARLLHRHGKRTVVFVEGSLLYARLDVLGYLLRGADVEDVAHRHGRLAPDVGRLEMVAVAAAVHGNVSSRPVAHVGGKRVGGGGEVCVGSFFLLGVVVVDQTDGLSVLVGAEVAVQLRGSGVG